jgi:hypothetical protein
MTIVGGRATWAQAVSFGVKGGVPFGDANAVKDESRPYIVGPTVEIRLPANFAIEIDALYRRLGNSAGFTYLLSGANLVSGNASSYFNRDRGNSWEFPFLGKYYFRPRAAWQPFVATGWSLRETWFHSDTSSSFTDQDGVFHAYKSHSSYTDGLGIGAVVATGVQFHMGRFALAPEARYTRWGGSNHDRTPRDEGGILLGIRF